MEISVEKTELMTNNTSGINTEIKVNEQKFETVKSFKYLGSVITDEGSKSEILSGIAQTTAALTRLKPVWNDGSISVSSHEVRAKIRLAIGSHEDPLTIVKGRKLQWHGHVSRSSGLAKTIFQGTVKGGNGQAWSSPSPRGQWRREKMEGTGCEIISGATTTLAVKG